MKNDRDLHHALNERLVSNEKQSMELVKTLLAKLTSENEQRKLLDKNTDDVRHLNHFCLSSLRTGSYDQILTDPCDVEFCRFMSTMNLI